jgi:predicted dehydrogenase
MYRLCFSCVFAIGILAMPRLVNAAELDTETIRVGVIGLDTSHAAAFTKELNKSDGAEGKAKLRVVAAYPYGSRSIESSSSRIPSITKEMEALDVEIVDSIAELLLKVDAVLLETNDGGLHREQAHEVFASGKPVFIDKPVAATLKDVVAIYDEAQSLGVPMFSSSALRYSGNVQAIRNGSIGKVLGYDAYSPCTTEPSHSDLYWYGIHGVETLFACMGEGCISVTRSSSDDFDVVVGTWADGRIGTFRGIRKGASGYAGTAFGEKGIVVIDKFEGYVPLARQIAEFFRTKKAPIAASETLEIYAFMEAAAQSKQKGGIPVTIESVMNAAK